MIYSLEHISPLSLTVHDLPFLAFYHTEKIHPFLLSGHFLIHEQYNTFLFTTYYSKNITLSIHRKGLQAQNRKNTDFFLGRFLRIIFENK